MNHYSLAIIGAGCAGLGLAQQLVKQGYSGNVVIVDQRDKFENDRTWCFWSSLDCEWQTLAKWSWQWGLFSDSDDNQVVHDYHQSQYVCLPADRYYQYCLSTIDEGNTQGSNISLQLRTPVVDVVGNNNHVVITTHQQTITADYVVDTRPSVAMPPALLYQRFYGQEVLLKRPISASHQARLMAGLQSSQSGLDFYYLLPFSDRHVLIEPTGFHTHAESPNNMENKIAAICDIEGIQIDTVIRHEQGILPMGMLGDNSTQHSRICKAGINGGALRAATGYGFVNIQRWAANCAQHLVSHNSPVSQPKAPTLQQKMDELLLQVIRHQPEIAPALFMQLANNMSAKAFVTLMTDNNRWHDWLKVVLALPAAPFLKQLPGVIKFSSQSMRA